MDHLGVSSETIDIAPAGPRRPSSELGHAPFGIDCRELDVEAFRRGAGARARRGAPRPDLRERAGPAADLPADVAGVRRRHRRPLGAGAGLVHLQRRPHEHVQPELLDPQDAGEVPGPLRGDERVPDGAGARDAAVDRRRRRSRPSCCRPPPAGEIEQSTEATLGPYELHDFILFNAVRCGYSPEKILFLSEHATFTQPYPRELIERTLRTFYTRFFRQQFKRSCVPDGPKVGTVSLSPRGDWRMPSDADPAEWLRWAYRANKPG